MDSRNVKEVTPEVTDGKYLEKIFELQESLLSHYIKIEGLPSYPLDVNSKKSQIILKDFTGRVIEELAEGFESQVLVNNLAKNQGYFQIHNGYIPGSPVMYNKAFEEAKGHVQNINEELADSLHFIMELLIYTNIGSEEIKYYLSKISMDFGIPYESHGDVLGESIDFGLRLTGMNLGINIYSFGVLDRDECTPIGWNAGESFINGVSHLLWDVTYSLSISRNCLKNKPWKQTGQLTDEITYQGLLVESFIKLCAYFGYLGLSSKTLFEIYFKKNCINQFRIKSKY